MEVYRNISKVSKVNNTFRERWSTRDGHSVIQGTKGTEIAKEFANFNSDYDESNVIRTVSECFFARHIDDTPDTIREISFTKIETAPGRGCTAHFTKVKFILLTKENWRNHSNFIEQTKKDDVISGDDYLLIERLKLITDMFIGEIDYKGYFHLDTNSQHDDWQNYTKDQKLEKFYKHRFLLSSRKEFHINYLCERINLDTYRTPFFIDDSFPTYCTKFFAPTAFIGEPVLKGVLFVANVYTRKRLEEKYADRFADLVRASYEYIDISLTQSLLKHFHQPQGGAIHTQQERQARITSNNYWLQRLLSGKVDLPTVISVLNIKPVGRSPKENLRKYVIKQRAKGLIDWDLFSKIYIYCQRKY